MTESSGFSPFMCLTHHIGARSQMSGGGFGRIQPSLWFPTDFQGQPVLQSNHGKQR